MRDWCKAEFKAQIADTLASLRFGGDGARIDLQSYDTEMAELQKLVFMKGQLLKVTIELIQEESEAQVGEPDPKEFEEPFGDLIPAKEYVSKSNRRSKTTKRA